MRGIERGCKTLFTLSTNKSKFSCSRFYRVWAGVDLGRELDQLVSPNPTGKAFQKVLELSKPELSRYVDSGDISVNPWRPIIGDLGIALQSDEFVRQCSENPETLVQELVDKVSSLFKCVEQPLYELNLELLHREQS